MSTEVVTERLDPENPWPGLDSFEENARDYFHGRDAEASLLLRRVTEAPLAVLFGKSGLGKTSILKAGLFPRLRETHFLPIYVRLDVRPGAPPLIGQLQSAFHAAIAAERIDAPAAGAGETLWEYLHRADLEFWSARNYPLTPVLVCDQFEEIFTHGERLSSEVQAFRLEFGDLAENRIPASISPGSGSDETRDDRLDLRSMRYKLVVSLREDFLPELEGWRRDIPSLGRVRVRLLPMSRQQAFSAVYETAPHLMDESLAKRIVEFVAAEQIPQSGAGPPGGVGVAAGEAAGRVEPALLSLFCRGLNERRKQGPRPKTRFDDELLEGAKQGIISDYYRSCVEGLPDSVSRFIETELITEKGFRNSHAREDAVPACLTEEQLQRLITRRLLRIEERYGTQRIELTHDLLTRAVREHRDWRRAEAERAVLARRAEEQRRELEEQVRLRESKMEEDRRAERERRLEAEARAGRKFRRLAAVLALALVATVAMALFARRQWNQAEMQRMATETARQDEKEQRGLAEARLDRITKGIRLKQAVLSYDLERILDALSSGPLNSTIRFSAREQYLYQNQGQRIYRFSVFPEKDSLPGGKDAVAAVTYTMAHPTFKNTKLIAGPERDFTASYDGWGCMTRVIVLIEFVDPDHPPEIAQFDMCAALGW